MILKFAGSCLALSALALPALAQLTEVPETVQPGRFLLEMDVLSVSVDRHTPERDGVKYSAVGVGSTFVSTGLTARLDVQVGFELFLRERYKGGGVRESNSGIGNVYLRSKWNFHRDDDAGVSVSVIPYVKLPTSSGGLGNDSVEGGLIVPWSVTLGGATSFNAMAAWDLVRNDNDDGYDSAWFASASLYRPLTATIGAYAEGTVGLTTAGSSRPALTAGVGVTWQLRPGFALDVAAYTGLTRGATDWNPVARIVWEF